MKAKRLAELAVLCAVSLVIFIVELQIPNPFPIPGVKLGLANVVTVWALYHCSAAQTALVLFARVLLASFFSGADCSARGTGFREYHDKAVCFT